MGIFPGIEWIEFGGVGILPEAMSKKFPRIVKKRGLGGVFAWGLGEDGVKWEHLEALTREVEAYGLGRKRFTDFKMSYETTRDNEYRCVVSSAYHSLGQPGVRNLSTKFRIAKTVAKSCHPIRSSFPS